MILDLVTSNLPIIYNTLIILIATLFITRVAGLRTFAKMSAIDFASTIAVGSVIASTILNDSTSPINGAVALCSIITFQLGSSYLQKKSNLINKVASNKPALLVRNGKILQKNLDDCGVSHEDLMAKLREANALKLSNVKAVVFETTGDISVLHGSDNKDVDHIILSGLDES